jgi:WLM domain
MTTPLQTACICVLLVVLVVLVVVLASGPSASRMIPVASKVDGRSYVVRDVPDKREAADLLARATQRLVLLVDHMRKSFPGDPDVAFMYDNFTADNVTETTTWDGNAAFTLDKGRQIALCLRSRETGRLQDLEVITFVAIHELAHLMTNEVGHPEKFYINNRRLLREAISLRLYKFIDFSRHPESYCGITIHDPVI